MVWTKPPCPFTSELFIKNVNNFHGSFFRDSSAPIDPLIDETLTYAQRFCHGRLPTKINACEL